MYGNKESPKTTFWRIKYGGVYESESLIEFDKQMTIYFSFDLNHLILGTNCLQIV